MLINSLLNKIERYPRLRYTEFSHRPFPDEAFQCREAEHPTKQLNKVQTIKIDDNFSECHIMPATTSDTRIARDSYFS